jgi:hypothetical protein
MAESILTSEEQYRFDTITKVILKEIKPGYAAKLLGVSPRQVRRLRIAVKAQGASAVRHKLKGRAGNHRIDPAIKEQALSVITKTYADFKPTFVTEKLEENHAIKLSYGTTRLWMMEKGLWKARKQKRSEYHSWRPRKDYFGELQQFDGSYHLWFENRFVDAGGNLLRSACLLVLTMRQEKLSKQYSQTMKGLPLFLRSGKSIFKRLANRCIFTLINFQPTKSTIKQPWTIKIS